MRGRDKREIEIQTWVRSSSRERSSPLYLLTEVSMEATFSLHWSTCSCSELYKAGAFTDCQSYFSSQHQVSKYPLRRLIRRITCSLTCSSFCLSSRSLAYLCALSVPAVKRVHRREMGTGTSCSHPPGCYSDVRSRFPARCSTD